MRFKVRKTMYLRACEQARGEQQTASAWIDESVAMLDRGDLDGYKPDPDLFRDGGYTVATCRGDYPAERIREAIARRLAMVGHEWPYSTHRRFLDLVIYVESFRGRTIGYEEADRIFQEKVNESKRRLQSE